KQNVGKMIVELFNRENESQLPICPKLILQGKSFVQSALIALSRYTQSLPSRKYSYQNYTPRTHDNPITDHQRSLGERDSLYLRRLK
ncbi:hypothetical protein N665_0717s0007, partial [Sinapis alba]